MKLFWKLLVILCRVPVVKRAVFAILLCAERTAKAMGRYFFEKGVEWDPNSRLTFKHVWEAFQNGGEFHLVKSNPGCHDLRNGQCSAQIELWEAGVPFEKFTIHVYGKSGNLEVVLKGGVIVWWELNHEGGQKAAFGWQEARTLDMVREMKRMCGGP